MDPTPEPFFSQAEIEAYGAALDTVNTDRVLTYLQRESMMPQLGEVALGHSVTLTPEMMPPPYRFDLSAGAYQNLANRLYLADLETTGYLDRHPLATPTLDAVCAALQAGMIVADPAAHAARALRFDLIVYALTHRIPPGLTTFRRPRDPRHITEEEVNAVQGPAWTPTSVLGKATAEAGRCRVEAQAASALLPVRVAGRQGDPGLFSRMMAVATGTEAKVAPTAKAATPTGKTDEELRRQTYLTEPEAAQLGKYSAEYLGDLRREGRDIPDDVFQQRTKNGSVRYVTRKWVSWLEQTEAAPRPRRGAISRRKKVCRAKPEGP